MRVFERTVDGSGYMNIIEAVFKAGSEERINDKYCAKS
jgi:hypothetical protein